MLLGIPGFDLSDGIILKKDSASAIKLSRNPEFHAKRKHFRLRHHFTQEKVQRGEVKLQWIPGRDQVADGFTKPLPRPVFEKSVDALALAESDCFLIKEVKVLEEYRVLFFGTSTHSPNKEQYGRTLKM